MSYQYPVSYPGQPYPYYQVPSQYPTAIPSAPTFYGPTYPYPQQPYVQQPTNIVYQPTQPIYPVYPVKK